MGTLDLKKWLLGSTLLIGASAVAFAPAAYAQDDADDVATIQNDDDDEADEDDGDTVVVTGSRVRRDAFSTIAPLQVIDSDTIKAAGLTETAEILKQQTVVTGVQLDTNINNAFVTNGGPGASSVALRGLGSDRTLVLVNGRRMAPAGVEGAPSFVDLNLIPSSIIQRAETLLDGAGSVYGSDAVAGVINLILRDDFEGVRLEATGRIPEEDGGERAQASFLMGGQTDRGNYVFAGEFAIVERLKLNQRDWQKSDAGVYCSLDIEVDSTTGQEFRNCDGAILGEFRTLTSPFATGGPGFDDFNLERREFDANGNEIFDESNTAVFRSFLQEGEDDIISRLERKSFYFSGNQGITVGGHDTNVFAEFSWCNRQSNARSGFHGQLFPTVPGSNPTTIFPGVDLVPVVSSPIRRGDVDTEVSQSRFVVGFEGELNDEWDYELFGSYARSQGYSTRPAVLEERLALSLATTRDDGNGNLICGNDLVDLFGFITQETCVPVDLFAPSLYDPTNPQFATQAELDYLSGERTVTSFNDQLMFGGYITGPVWSTGAGDIQTVLGFEAREDSVETRTDTIAATGGAAGFFADKPSIGSVKLFEVYGEAIIPIASGKRFAEDINLELAGRYIDHEFFGNESVYSVKGNWAPTDWLNFRGTYGTSFRAPGLRELFLGGQSGFISGNNDPCIVPIGARNDDDGDPVTPPIYDASQDTRDPVVLANCVSEGVDPTTLGISGSSSIEAFTAGNNGLDAETSEAYTAGFVIDQPWFDRFDLRFSATYFNIEVNDATANPGGGFILSQCYNSVNFPNDPFCQRRERDPNTGFLTSIDTTPFNLAFFTSAGIDYNLAGAIDFTQFNRDWTFSFDTQITNQTERDQQNLATAPVSDAVGDIGFPEWRSVTNARLETGPWTAFYRLRHIGEQNDINRQTGELQVFTPDGTFAEINGVDTTADTVNVNVDTYYVHTASLRYQGEGWSATVGVENFTDEDPPLLDQNVGFTGGSTNVPLGVGYDLFGRTVFVNAVKEF